jgi:hypothetical protein
VLSNTGGTLSFQSEEGGQAQAGAGGANYTFIAHAAQWLITTRGIVLYNTYLFVVATYNYSLFLCISDSIIIIIIIIRYFAKEYK